MSIKGFPDFIYKTPQGKIANKHIFLLKCKIILSSVWGVAGSEQDTEVEFAYGSEFAWNHYEKKCQF